MFAAAFSLLCRGLQSRKTTQAVLRVLCPHPVHSTHPQLPGLPVGTDTLLRDSYRWFAYTQGAGFKPGDQKGCLRFLEAQVSLGVTLTAESLRHGTGLGFKPREELELLRGWTSRQIKKMTGCLGRALPP